MERNLDLLVVDDDVDLTTNLKDVLEAEGYSTSVAHDGQTALVLCHRKPVPLALIDIKLPDMSGLELTEKLVGLFPGMEAIIITGHASLETAIAAIKQERIVAYEVKPLNMDQILALTTQIAARKKLEGNLESERDKLQALIHGLERTEIGIDIVGPDYKVMFQNQGLTERFSHLTGKLCYEGYMGRNEPCDCCPMKKALRNNNGNNIVSLEFTGIDGRNYQLISAPFLYPDETVYRVIEVIVDITGRRQMEKKLIEYEELNKLKSELLAKVSHELRSPLATIKGYSTMLLGYEHRLWHGEKHEYLRAIDDATDRLTHLVSQLLDMSRIETGLIKLYKEPTNISELLEKAANEAQLRSPGHKILKKLGTRLPKVNIDAKRIREVMDNLIDNACKYSQEGTEVVVSARRNSHNLLISVADQGIGIPADKLERVFDQMYRIERVPSPGTDSLGLGLAISKGLVEAHGGCIWVESEVGEGSTLYFSIPIQNKATDDE
jgi:signal transduction histidine kinase/ActR/RegA family two-component response regulator